MYVEKAAKNDVRTKNVDEIDTWFMEFQHQKEVAIHFLFWHYKFPFCVNKVLLL
jgi:hypothetical protein